MTHTRAFLRANRRPQERLQANWLLEATRMALIVYLSTTLYFSSRFGT